MQYHWILLAFFSLPALAGRSTDFNEGHVYPVYRDGHRAAGHRVADPDADGYYIRQHLSNHGRVYEWTKPDLGSTSICVELDGETRGEKYRLPVEDQNCEKPVTIQQWSAPTEGLHSRCYSVDAATEGNIYRRLERDEKCRKPEMAFVWLKTEGDAKDTCYEIDSETRGRSYRHAAGSERCPHTFDPYVAYAREKPLLNPVVPFVEKNGGGRMPASLAKPTEEPLEERDPKEFWEDPEDMIRHVPDDSRKGHY